MNARRTDRQHFKRPENSNFLPNSPKTTFPSDRRSSSGRSSPSTRVSSSGWSSPAWHRTSGHRGVEPYWVEVRWCRSNSWRTYRLYHLPFGGERQFSWRRRPAASASPTALPHTHIYTCYVLTIQHTSFAIVICRSQSADHTAPPTSRWAVAILARNVTGVRVFENFRFIIMVGFFNDCERCGSFLFWINQRPLFDVHTYINIFFYLFDDRYFSCIAKVSQCSFRYMHRFLALFN